MALSDSILSYEDIRNTLDRALASGRGIRVRQESPGKAIYFAQRCNKFRQLQRRENRDIYSEGDPMYGKSPYDVLMIRAPKGEAYVDILKSESIEMEIEEL